MTATSAAPKSDRRVQRSRNALRDAFRQLILARGYEAIAVADITELANVGRSTFYEHYAGRDDLLAQSLHHAFTVVSETSLSPSFDPAMTSVLQHFWDNRKVGAALLSGDAARVLQALMVARFQAALSARWPGPFDPARQKLLAVSLAAGQLAVIRDWTAGRLSGGAEEIAEGLWRTCRASALATCGGEP